jgi:membrane-bound ClpP family serine protease
MSAGQRSTFARYLLFEIPGWIVAALVLGLLVHFGELSLRTAAILLAVFVLKDFALYPVLRVGYLPSPPDGASSLVGALGTARDRLDPVGWVRVGSELWRAEVVREQAPVEAGARVRVIAVGRELTLRVERA